MAQRLKQPSKRAGGAMHMQVGQQRGRAEGGASVAKNEVSFREVVFAACPNGKEGVDMKGGDLAGSSQKEKWTAG